MTFSNSIDTPHHFFARMAGNWRGTSKLWLEPEKLAEEYPVVGTIQLLLEGRFALFSVSRFYRRRSPAWNVYFWLQHHARTI
ncbi:MAG: DUF1579 family protein [Anaerolineales bacterium]|nr:DUF1579 family protein [Anaerolineales bacterium]